jgi:hypothetical protein
MLTMTESDMEQILLEIKVGGFKESNAMLEVFGLVHLRQTFGLLGLIQKDVL